MLTTNQLTMNKLIAFVTVLILPIAFLSACEDSKLNTDCPAGWTGPSCATRVSDGAGAGDSSTQETGTQSEEPKPDEYTGLTYDLPEGWYQDEGDVPIKDAFRDETDPSFRYEPFSKIAFSRPYNGTEQDALKSICWPDNYSDGACQYIDEDGLKTGELIISGRKVFFNASQGIHGGDELWGNSVAFEKDGVVFEIEFMGDNIDQYQNELQTIVGSIKAVK